MNVPDPITMLRMLAASAKKKRAAIATFSERSPDRAHRKIRNTMARLSRRKNRR